MRAPRKVPPKRPALHAYLTDSSFEAWHLFSSANGVSVTALLEVMGEFIRLEMATAGHADIRQEWVKAARKVDADRRRRG